MATKTKKASGKAADVKAVKHADIRGKTPDELKDQLLGLKKEQFNLRFQRATQQLEKPARVREVRREIARVKTILGEKAAAK
jgi:large subunit ribosomal protein L29